MAETVVVVGVPPVTETFSDRTAALFRRFRDGALSVPGRIKVATVNASRWSRSKLRAAYRWIINSGRGFAAGFWNGLKAIGRGTGRAVGVTGFVGLEATSRVVNTLRFISALTYAGTMIWTAMLGLTIAWAADKAHRYAIRYPQAVTAWLAAGRPGTLKEFIAARGVERREFLRPAREFYRDAMRQGAWGIGQARVEAADRETDLNIMEPDSSYLLEGGYDQYSFPEIEAFHRNLFEYYIKEQHPQQFYMGARLYVLAMLTTDPDKLPSMDEDGDSLADLYFRDNSRVLEERDFWLESQGIDVESEARQGAVDELAAIHNKANLEEALDELREMKLARNKRSGNPAKKAAAKKATAKS